jgi:hypothetical protein
MACVAAAERSDPLSVRRPRPAADGPPGLALRRVVAGGEGRGTNQGQKGSRAQSRKASRWS